MSVTRVMGIETEYGIAVPSDPRANPMLTSSQLVNAYANSVADNPGSRARWDYELETPLRDARGFEAAAPRSSESGAEADTGMANAVLTNGARLYVDHAHPEYSTPEVLTPFDAVVYDRAGQEIMRRAATLALAAGGSGPIRVYKNNTDNKGASYGTHENYLMPRQTPFERIVAGLIPFFVTRQVITGAGRVGIGQDGRRAGFQLSQRADFFEVEVGLETTLKRPIVNTRDEPHADPKHYRRLHVIVGDANLSETATYLKLGMTSLVLALIESDRIPEDLGLVRPVSEIHAVSHDPTLRHRLALQDGRHLTAIDVQREYVLAARKFVEAEQGADAHPQTLDILDRWELTLDRLARDPAECATELDWVAKLAVLDGYRRRDGLDWDSARLALVDLQYADLEPGKGVADWLEQNGRLARLTTDEQVARAVTDAPPDTRAWFRGECMRRYPRSVAAASWDSVVFESASRRSLQRVPTLDPLRGTRDHVSALLDRCESVDALLNELSAG